MRPVDIEVLAEVDSTQDEMKRRASAGRPLPEVLLARRQTKGRGRFDRTWLSGDQDSLTMSLAVREWINHPKPWLTGMAAALAAASVLHARVQWPNDVVIRKRKLAGVLVELLDIGDGDKIPVVGVGINLLQTEFDTAIAHRATSLFLERGVKLEPDTAGAEIAERIKEYGAWRTWSELQPIWELFDDTPGKEYTLHSGEKATAISVGAEGMLVCSVDGETRAVLAAEAILGRS